jgi:hypothetical protein
MCHRQAACERVNSAVGAGSIPLAGFGNAVVKFQLLKELGNS